MRSLDAVAITVVALLAVALDAPAKLGAQSPGAPATRAAKPTHAVTGIVVDTLGRPLAGAEVSIDGRRAARTDEQGRFVAAGLDPATFYVVSARRIGFGEAHGQIVAGDGPTTEIRLELAGQIARLAGLKVTADRVTPFEQFEAHRRRGFGTFFDHVDIAEREPWVLTDLLRSVPAVWVVRQKRGPPELMVMGRRMAQPCGMNLVINGVYRQLLDPTHFNDVAGSMNQIQAVEVYPRAIDTPGEYRQHPDQWVCGTVAIWTIPGARRTTDASNRGR